MSTSKYVDAGNGPLPSTDDNVRYPAPREDLRLHAEAERATTKLLSNVATFAIWQDIHDTIILRESTANEMHHFRKVESTNA